MQAMYLVVKWRSHSTLASTSRETRRRTGNWTFRVGRTEIATTWKGLQTWETAQ